MLFDQDEYHRWLTQAEQTLKAAKDDLHNANYNWCCFKAQQSAEYAVKALLRGVGELAIGHSILKLLERLEDIGSKVSEKLRGFARTLDNHYIPPRYPNAFAEGAPYEFYDDKKAEEALSCAEEIIQFVKKERDKHG